MQICQNDECKTSTLAGRNSARCSILSLNYLLSIVSNVRLLHCWWGTSTRHVQNRPVNWTKCRVISDVYWRFHAHHTICWGPNQSEIDITGLFAIRLGSFSHGAELQKRSKKQTERKKKEKVNTVWEESKAENVLVKHFLSFKVGVEIRNITRGRKTLSLCTNERAERKLLQYLLTICRRHGDSAALRVKKIKGYNKFVSFDSLPADESIQSRSGSGTSPLRSETLGPESDCCILTPGFCSNGRNTTWKHA